MGWELGSFPTKLVAQWRFVGIRSRFCAENSGIFRQNRSRGDVLSEWEPVGSLEVRCFSDKTGRTGALCRNTQSVLRWEHEVFPTKQVARGRFVGIGGRFCAGNTRFFRQNSLRRCVLSEYAVGFMLRTLGFSDKSVCTGTFCRNGNRYIRWKFAVFPTNQVARRLFVGIRSRFCAENSGIFRQN